MNSNSLMRWAASLAVIVGGSAAFAQAPVFVATDSQMLSATDAVAEAPVKVSRGSMRAAPVVMETRGHVHADGSVSTTCGAIPSSVPHSVPATRAIAKQQER